MILTIEKNGNAPFAYPTINYLNTNRQFSKDILHIDQCHNRVDPANPQAHLEQVSNTGYTKRFPVLVNIVDDDHANLNNASNRRNFAETFVHFFNHPETQRAYTYPSLAQFAGDLTPQNEANSPHLSEYLTIRDTMEVMREALAGSDEVMAGSLPSIGDVMDVEGIMEDYYSPRVLEQAQNVFAPFRSHVSGGQAALAQVNQGGAPEPDYGDFHGFRYNNP